MIQAGQSICAPVGERITPYTRAHPFSHRYEMNLARNNVLWESHAHCPCAPFLPTSDAARQRARQALRAMGASSLLRDSHRAAAMIQAGPWLRELATSAPPGPALLSTGSGKVRAASHPSGKLAAGSFTGIPAGRVTFREHRNFKANGEKDTQCWACAGLRAAAGLIVTIWTA